MRSRYPKSSTTLALISLHDRITTLLERQNVKGTAILAYDFSKAFDQLGHSTIIDTMINLNLPLGFIQWSLNYLSHRLQAVKIHNAISSPLPVTSGIPQGSLLGPFFFNIVIGTLRESNEDTRIIKYIDDCTFVVPLNSSDSILVTLEHDNMLQWAQRVGLKINLNKSKCLCICTTPSTVCPTLADISQVKNLKLLGVIFTEDLKWKLHIQSTAKNASRRLYALRILRSLLPRAELKLIYHGLIRSVLEYCSPVFVGLFAKDESVLASVQKRAHRIICGPTCNCNDFPSLKLRRCAASVKVINACSNPDHILHDQCPRKSLSQRFIMPPCSTQRRLLSFFPQAVLLANSEI